MTWRLLTTLCLFLTCPLALQAQPRPGAFSTLTVSNTGAAALDVAGGITAGTGNVAIVDTTGKIPAISSTYFGSLSGTNLTGVARLASAEDITGTWTLANNVPLQSRNGSGTAYNLVSTLTNETVLGPTNAQVAGGIGTNTTITAAGTVTITTNQVQRTTWDNAGLLTHAGAIVYSGIISATLASGDNNDWNPTGLANARTVIITPDAAGSTITGIAGGVAGRELTICQPSDAANDTILEQNTDSSAANRLTLGVATTIQYYSTLPDVAMGPCVTFLYDGTTSKWLFKSASVLMVP